MAVKLFATRLAPHGIPVFEVRPGIVDTDMIASMLDWVAERFQDARETQSASKEPKGAEGVPAARKRVSAELELIGYVQAIYAASQGEAGHAE